MTIGYGSYTKYKRSCLYCGSHFQTVLNPTALRLGPGHRHCGQCEKEFSDGSIEWPNMTSAQKRKFLFGELPMFAALGALWVAFMMFAGVRNGSFEIAVEALGLFFLPLGIAILGIFYLICWLDIRRSKRRARARNI